MATTSEIYVQIDDIEPIVKEWKKYFKTGKEILSNSKHEFFTDNNNIFFCKGECKHWILINIDSEVGLISGNLYRFDEILRRISQTLNTTILLAFYQSTLGEGRIAKFEKGVLVYSFYQKYSYYKDDTKTIDEIYVADNFGVENCKLAAIQNLKMYDDVLIFDTDFLNDFCRSENVQLLWQEDSEYLHLEIIE